MLTFQDFLRWYNNKNVVNTLEVNTKMLTFYHTKQIDMLKLGYTLQFGKPVSSALNGS